MAVVGLLSALWLPVYSAILLGWSCGVLFYLAMTLAVQCRLSPSEIRDLAAALDEGANTVTTAAVLASLTVMTAVVLELSAGRASAWSVPLAGSTVVLSWAFIHVLFAHRYAHENALRGGLVFPGEDEPDFVECLYFAFTIGMTAQVSDVTTNSSAIRRLVLLHALLAFFFNAAVLAAAINLAAGLVD